MVGEVDAITGQHAGKQRRNVLLHRFFRKRTRTELCNGFAYRTAHCCRGSSLLQSCADGEQLGEKSQFQCLAQKANAG